MLFRWISTIYLKLAGWKLVGEKPAIKKYIFVMAPHTSQLDFMLGRMYSSIHRIKAKFLIKKESFWFPLGLILKAMGGVPVDRSSNQHLADQLIHKFKDSDEYVLIIAPEGTRKRVTRWKKGFHHIALQAGIPLVLSFVDFKTRRMGIGPTIYVTDDYQADLKIIKDFYRGMEGKHPDRFSVGD